MERPLPTSFDPKQHQINLLHQDKNVVAPYSIDEFEEFAGMQYLSQLAFKNPDVYADVKNECLKAERTGRVSQRAKWIGARYEKEIYSGYINAVSVQWIDEKIGYGLFAEKKIHDDEYIGQFTGVLREWNWLFSPRLNEYCFRYPLYHMWFKRFTVDAEKWGNETSFINHSNTPNSETLVGYVNHLYHVNVIAIREIEKGEQITYDYGNNRFS